MNILDQLLAQPPYSLDKNEKADLYRSELSRLTRHHISSCPPYGQMLSGLGQSLERDLNTETLPFLPVRLFKDFELRSIPQSDIQKTMTSSGTSGQAVSRIFLDRQTATYQTKVLSKIVTDLLGPKRLPMLVIDAKETVKNRYSFSARGAGILGFSMFGRDVTYALDADMQLDMDIVQAFLEKHADSDIFIFGFTSIVYQHLILALQREHPKLTLDRGILLHGGGWKKLEDISVNNDRYKALLDETTGIKRVHNYYGMVEQTGSIFMECPEGFMHCSDFSDILVRDEQLSSLPHGQKGLLQLVSLLPHSYPGHSILSEDIGETFGEDDCRCGRKGKYFRIYGRAKQAEVRGCSDTYAA